MFWFGLIVGIIIETVAIAGFVWLCFRKTYGDLETFESSVEVIKAACENRESEVYVYHDGEILTQAVFKEI